MSERQLNVEGEYDDLRKVLVQLIQGEMTGWGTSSRISCLQFSGKASSISGNVPLLGKHGRITPRPASDF